MGWPQAHATPREVRGVVGPVQVRPGGDTTIIIVFGNQTITDYGSKGGVDGRECEAALFG